MAIPIAMILAAMFFELRAAHCAEEKRFATLRTALFFFGIVLMLILYFIG